MKNSKAILFALLTIMVLQSKAQWYGQLSYTHDSTILCAARRTTVHAGSVMAGYRGVRQAGNFSPDFVVDKTDPYGAFPGPTDFSGEYQIIQNGCSVSGPVNNSYGVDILETNNVAYNEAYAIAAAFKNGVFFATLDPQGNFSRSFFWDFPVIPDPMFFKRPAIRESKIPGYYYICGAYRYDSAYVMKVNANTSPITPVWSNFYSSHDMQPRDLIESPYTGDELIVVGRATASPTSTTAEDAFFLRLSAYNGSVLSYSVYNKQFDSDEGFACIETATCTFGGSNGYVLGGWCNFATHTYTNPCTLTYEHNRSFSQWMCKLDQTGTVMWSSLIEPYAASSYTAYGPWPGCAQATGSFAGAPGAEISRVYERYNNNTNAFEYYGTAEQYLAPSPTAPGYANIENLAVFKLDESGSTGTLSPNEFHYLTARVPHFISSHAQITGIETNGSSGDDGIQVFGTRSSAGNREHYFVKAYFNGMSGCKDTTINIDNIYPGPDSVAAPGVTVNTFNYICQNAISLNVNILTATTSVACYASSLSNGSNARNSMTTNVINYNNENNIILYPNPTNNKLVIDKKGLGSNKPIYATLTDNLGRKIKTFYWANAGENEIELKALDLNSGIYFLNVLTEDGTVHFKIIYNAE